MERERRQQNGNQCCVPTLSSRHWRQTNRDNCRSSRQNSIETGWHTRGKGAYHIILTIPCHTFGKTTYCRNRRRDCRCTSPLRGIGPAISLCTHASGAHPPRNPVP